MKKVVHIVTDIVCTDESTYFYRYECFGVICLMTY